MISKFKKSLKAFAIFSGVCTYLLFFQNCSRLETLDQMSSANLSSQLGGALKSDGLLNYCSSEKKPVLDGITVSVAGSQETVWVPPAGNDVEGPIPDGVISAYRDAQGKVSLLLPHAKTYRLTGYSLNTINPNSTELVFQSAKSVSEGDYNFAHWLFAPYSNDGVNFVGINHHEWYACLIKGDCNNSLQTIYASWFNSITKVVSNNGGGSWSVPNDHLIIAPPAWNKQPYLGKPQNNRGIFHPSRVVKEGNFYYLIAYVATSPDDVPAGQGYSGMMMLRTADFNSWQVWTGGSSYGPVGSVKPALIAGTDTVVVSLTYNSSLCAYMMVYTSGMLGRGGQSVKYRLSPSMLNPQWTAEKEVLGSAKVRLSETLVGDGFVVNNYPSLIDPSSGGYSFEITGSSPYLYYSTFGPNAFVRTIYRLPLKVEGNGVIPSVTPAPTPLPRDTAPTPTPTTPTPVTIPVGPFTVASSLYYSNGGSYCYFPTWNSFVQSTNRNSLEGVANYSAIPATMRNVGTCQSGGVTQPPAAPISGLFMVGIGIYYSNGSYYCYFSDWNEFTARTGKSNADGVQVLGAVPTNLIPDGACR